MANKIKSNKHFDKLVNDLAKIENKRKQCENSNVEAQILSLFNILSNADKIKICNKLDHIIASKIDKVMRDTFEPDYDGCEGFFLEYPYNRDVEVSAYSGYTENISFPLKWLEDGYDYKSEYKKMCEEEEEREKRHIEYEERDMLRRLKAKYEK